MHRSAIRAPLRVRLCTTLTTSGRPRPVRRCMQVGLLDEQHHSEGGAEQPDTPSGRDHDRDRGDDVYLTASDFAGNDALCPPQHLRRERAPGIRKRIKSRIQEPYKHPDWSHAKLESLDFDSINSPYWLDLARRPARSIFGYSGKTFTRWGLSIVIGFFVALSGRLIALAIEHIAGFRNAKIQHLFDSSEPDSHAFIFFVLYNGALVLVGSLLTVFVEPSAAAGGIPEIKAYLNGTHVKNFLRLRAITVKIVVSCKVSCQREMRLELRALPRCLR